MFGSLKILFFILYALIGQAEELVCLNGGTQINSEVNNF